MSLTFLMASCLQDSANFTKIQSSVINLSFVLISTFSVLSPLNETVQHTSASLTINENYDSDVRVDTETFLNSVVPEGNSAPWRHTLEGPDDMPAHIKSSMFGCTLSIPITNGKLNMGTWQGIWLCEHRDSATARRIVVTLNGT